MLNDSEFLSRIIPTILPLQLQLLVRMLFKFGGERLTWSMMANKESSRTSSAALVHCSHHVITIGLCDRNSASPAIFVERIGLSVKPGSCSFRSARHDLPPHH